MVTGAFGQAGLVDKEPDPLSCAFRVAIFTQIAFFLLDHKMTYSP